MEQIFYLATDTTGQSQLAAAIARIKYPTATVTATDGLDESGMAALVSALTDNTHDDICVCMPMVASHAAGKFTFAQAITLIPKLKTAKQGTNVEGTARSNSTKTKIVLAASGPSAVNDFYNGRLIATAGSTAISRIITDYTGSSKECVVADTGTAITTTESYTVYMTDYLHLIGESYYVGASQNACYTAFKNLFPDVIQIPTLVTMMSGGTNLFLKTNLTATSAAAAYIEDTGEFSSGAYDAQDYYLAISEGTLGNGQIRKITTNTANRLNVSPSFTTTPTGTTKYQLKKGSNRLLWDKYLAKAIPTYFQTNSGETWSLFKRMIDRYGDIYAGAKYGYEDEALIEEYVAKGKVICEALWAGVVS